MNPNPGEEQYKVWAADNMIYGPVNVDTLIQWAQEERVLADTWIHSALENEWRTAKKIEPLRPYFSDVPQTAFFERSSPSDGVIGPEELRQFSVFASVSNHELEQFIRFGELRHVQPDEQVIKKGEPGDAVFFVLSGEMRARLMVGQEDKTLAKIPAGEFFGEMAMFTQTPRSADVVGEAESRLLRLSSQAFHLLIKEIPALAAPILFGMSRVMANRISQDNRRWQKEVASEFVWR